MADNQKQFLPLTPSQIQQLEKNGCRAKDWQKVLVHKGLIDPERFLGVYFSGTVRLEEQTGAVRLSETITEECGVYQAALHNVYLASNVFVRNVNNRVENYAIGSGAVIDNVDLLAGAGPSSFGNGVEASVVCEAGGREVMLYDRLTAQVAHLLAFGRHRPLMVEKLRDLIRKYTSTVAGEIGRVSAGAKVINCGTIVNAKIGAGAVVDSAVRLENVSINSCPEDPARIGPGSIVRDSIVCAGATVTDGAQLERCFVGQTVNVSKGFCGVDSLFFANTDVQQGEACSVFAGPFCVSHHKSTLLLAGGYSFFNAGSGTNQSNHMYKLGPVHQGVFERGAKTASDGYVSWPARIGAFSVVLGRIYGNPDTGDLPFSYVVEKDGQGRCIPGVTLRNAGTCRDELKWPSRDQRKSADVLDQVVFDVLSPYTGGKLLRGIEVLSQLQAKAEPDDKFLSYGNVLIARYNLETGISLYQLGLDVYLGSVLAARLSGAGFGEIGQVREVLKTKTEIGRGTWLDLSGLLVPGEALEKIIDFVENEPVDSVHVVEDQFRKLYRHYREYEWTWVSGALEKRYGKTPADFTAEEIAGVLEQYIESVRALYEMRRNDGLREFEESGMISFGLSDDPDVVRRDFAAVRGTAEENAFLKKLGSVTQARVDAAQEILAKVRKL